MGSIPGLEALHESRANKGMTVLGVTRQYDKRGLLPDSRDELFKPNRSGELYTGTTTEEYIAHLKAFHERVEMPYPIVLGTSKDMKNYQVYGIPTVFVIDREGIINFVAIGGRRGKLLETVVDRLLDDDDKPADDQGSLSPASQKALDAWKAQNDALVTAMKLVTEARTRESNARTVEERKAAAKAKEEAGQKASDLLQDTRKQFADALAKADWDEFKGDEYAEMLDSGLVQVGLDALEGDPALAVRAFEYELGHFPGSSSYGTVAGEYLPWAYATALEPDQAYVKTSALLENASASVKASIELWLGDIKAMAGDYEEARKHYGSVEVLADGDKSKARLVAYAKARGELIGKPAPEIDATWFGADSKKLSELQGRVVVLDFWATWCAPCRYAMVGLDELAKENPEVTVLGVTKKFDHGFLPEDAGQMHVKFSRGEVVRDIAPDNYADHLKTFRERSGIGYPFALAKDEEVAGYDINAWPTMYVVDKQGRIAFATVGGNKELLLKKVVARLQKQAETQK